MLKSILIAAILSTALALPAVGAEMKCDEASMKMMENQMMGMKDMGTKDKAMKEMEMAKDAMKMNKMDDCKMHMNKAMNDMM